MGLAAGMCACASDARAQGSVAEDRAALMAFYDAFDVQEWDDDENWAGDAPLGEWSGVTTDESGRVTKLEVFKLQPGAIPVPAELGNLTKLEVLELSGLPPRPGDHVPMLRGSIPAEFGNLRMLKELHLEYNELSGPIPAELANLTKLEKLILGDDWWGTSSVDGPIPAWLGNLTQLKVLHLGGNRLLHLGWRCWQPAERPDSGGAREPDAVGGAGPRRQPAERSCSGRIGAVHRAPVVATLLQPA